MGNARLGHLTERFTTMDLRHHGTRHGLLTCRSPPASFTQRTPSPVRPMPDSGLTSGRILVVDDQPANLRAVSALLTRHGYEVATAGHGEEALAVATQTVPDL